MSQPPPPDVAEMPKRTRGDRCQGIALLFLMPYLNEIKDSWEFAAVPLHFLAQGWPLSMWGLTISLATLCRLPIHGLVTWQGACAALEIPLSRISHAIV